MNGGPGGSEYRPVDAGPDVTGSDPMNGRKTVTPNERDTNRGLGGPFQLFGLSGP